MQKKAVTEVFSEVIKDSRCKKDIFRQGRGDNGVV
jgi:hypothetical protein